MANTRELMLCSSLHERRQISLVQRTSVRLRVLLILLTCTLSKANVEEDDQSPVHRSGLKR